MDAEPAGECISTAPVMLGFLLRNCRLAQWESLRSYLEELNKEPPITGIQHPESPLAHYVERALYSLVQRGQGSGAVAAAITRVFPEVVERVRNGQSKGLPPKASDTHLRSTLNAPTPIYEGFSGNCAPHHTIAFDSQLHAGGPRG